MLWSPASIWALWATDVALVGSREFRPGLCPMEVRLLETRARDGLRPVRWRSSGLDKGAVPASRLAPGRPRSRVPFPGPARSDGALPTADTVQDEDRQRDDGEDDENGPQHGEAPSG